jgi:hypothetical protein
MNPTGESEVNGVVSMKLGGLSLERQLSEKEAEVWADVARSRDNLVLFDEFKG